MSGNRISSSFIRNFVFGVEDSLVSTVGLLSGIAAAGISKQNIILTGIVLIFVEAFSMAIGSILSEHSAKEYEQKSHIPLIHSISEGTVMFFSYFISGFIPLFPYFVFNISKAFIVSIIFSLAALFILGIIGAKISHANVYRGGMRMSIVGGIAIGVGVLAGKLVGIF